MTYPKILDVLKLTERKLDSNTVDCGTCPVSLACAASQGGTGWRFPCCGAAAVETLVDRQHLVLVLDCANNAFENTRSDAEYSKSKCPLCTGDLIEWAVRGNTETYRYVRTVHAHVPLKTRLDLWRERLPVAQARVQAEDARKAAQ